MADLRYVLVYVVVLMCMTGCSAAQMVPEPESPGAKLYLKKCAQCHGLPGPKRHTPEQWDHFLAMMKGFMDERGYPFSANEKKIIQEYLHRNAR